MTLYQKSIRQKILKSMHRDKRAKMAILQKIATLPFLHFCPCISISKIFLAKMTFGWVLWKSSYTILLKKCLRPCPGLSMYLSERVNWIISSFPRWISKILFVLGSWDHFGSLGCRMGECPFFHVSILLLGSVSELTSESSKYGKFKSDLQVGTY